MEILATRPRAQTHSRRKKGEEKGEGLCEVSVRGPRNVRWSRGSRTEGPREEGAEHITSTEEFRSMAVDILSSLLAM
jgi:hypothetical protein